MQWDAVGDDLRGEERDAGDHQQEAVEGRATLEQRSPAKEKERCCITQLGGRHPTLRSEVQGFESTRTQKRMLAT